MKAQKGVIVTPEQRMMNHLLQQAELNIVFKKPHTGVRSLFLCFGSSWLCRAFVTHAEAITATQRSETGAGGSHTRGSLRSPEGDKLAGVDNPCDGASESHRWRANVRLFQSVDTVEERRTPPRRFLSGGAPRGRKHNPSSTREDASGSKDPYCSFLSRRRRFLDWHYIVASPELLPRITNCETQRAKDLLNCKYLVIGDTKHTPLEVEIPPAILTSDPKTFYLMARCVHPPLFLPEGQVIAQAIPVPQFLCDDLDLSIFYTEILGEEKPLVWCGLKNEGHSIQLQGMMDTGADVTVIPPHKWPSQWELQDVDSAVLGVGGTQLARQSKSIVQIKGPNGQLASVRPFVLNSKFTLWGRDAMSQWGAKLELPAPQDF
ncbi:uncharacterized protein LOC144246100 [Lonchura striata]